MFVYNFRVAALIHNLLAATIALFRKVFLPHAKQMGGSHLHCPIDFFERRNLKEAIDEAPLIIRKPMESNR